MPIAPSPIVSPSSNSAGHEPRSPLIASCEGEPGGRNITSANICWAESIHSCFMTEDLILAVTR